MSQLVAHLPNIHKALGAILGTAHARVLTHTHTQKDKSRVDELAGPSPNFAPDPLK